MKKQQGNFTNEKERTKDILQTLGEQKRDQYVVGFAAETSRPMEHGEDKLRRKHLDAIIVNDISEDGAGFGLHTNKGMFITKHLEKTELPLAQKEQMAEQILRLIVKELKDEAK